MKTHKPYDSRFPCQGSIELDESSWCDVGDAQEQSGKGGREGGGEGPAMITIAIAQ